MGQFNSPMMLSKKFDPKKVEYPCVVTPKMDGVPVLMSKDGFVSRDGKPITSLPTVQKLLEPFFDRFPTVTLIGEVYAHMVPFKDISGAVRNKTEECIYSPVLFDMFDIARPAKYYERIGFLRTYLSDKFIVKGELVGSEEYIYYYHKHFMAEGYEGTMIRNVDAYYEQGKRSWGCMKLKDEPTMDLEVVGFTEAISLEGEPKGMVGALQCKYKDTVVNIGAGALLHEERASILVNQADYVGKIAEVKYMPDATYDKLRQPTFVRWRDDKDTESYE